MNKVGEEFRIPNSSCPFTVAISADKKTALLTAPRTRISFSLVVPADLAERLVKECGFEKCADIEGNLPGGR